MQIDRIICPVAIADKLAAKHGLQVQEVRHALYRAPRIRFAERGNRSGEDVYAAFGQTLGGRYVVIFFIYRADTATALIREGTKSVWTKISEAAYRRPQP